MRPVRKQVTDVDEDGWRGVGFGARREDGHGRPGCGGSVVPFSGASGRGDYLETGLAGTLEEEGDGAVV